MNKTVFLSLLTVLVLGSVFFLGRGIDSLVVSETCCYGPQCTLENACDSLKPMEKHMMSGDLFMGIILLIGVFVVLYTHARDLKKLV